MSDGSGRFASSRRACRHRRRGGRAVRRLRQRRPARSAGPDAAGVASVPQCRQRVGGRTDERLSRLPRRHFSRWPSATSTATATQTSSCALAGRRAARLAERRRQQRIVRCTFGWRVESATAAASARRSTCAPAACVSDSSRLRQRRQSRRPTCCSASAREPRRTPFACCGRRARCRRSWTSDLPPAPQVRRPAASPSTELDRKPSSCPFLYTWNGTRFEFVTDFMGGGEMGYWVGPATYGTRRIPTSTSASAATSSKPRDGRYELRVTNELEETLFVDRLQLVAVDHPADVEVYPNEGLKAPPSGVRAHDDARRAAGRARDRGWRARRDRSRGGGRSQLSGRFSRSAPSAATPSRTR